MALQTTVTEEKPRWGVRTWSGLSKGVRETIANIGWMGGDRILRMGGGVLVGTVVARYLGPSNLGILNYALAVYAIFNVVSNLGLDTLVVRDIALLPETEDQVLGTSFVLKILASLVTTALAILFTMVVRPHDAVSVVIVALTSVAAISQGFDVVDFFLQAKTRSRFSVVPKSIVFVVASIARLAAAFSKMPLLTFAWIQALEILFTELSLGVAYLGYHKRLRLWSFDGKLALSLVKESWPLMCSSVLILIYMRCDQILLGSLAPPAAVGLYSVSLKISEIWYSIPILICASVMPRLLKYRLSNPAVYRQRLQKLYDAMGALSILIGIFVSIFGKYIILLMYGQKYSGAFPILSIHIWTGVFVFLGIVSGYQMIYEDLSKLKLWRTLFGAFANIGLNILFIPRFGAIGSAVATLIVYGAVAYGADLLNPRTRHIFRMKTHAYLCVPLFDGSLWRRKEVSA